jgi:5S rRNA maturation endonuclease (ribonuclease M5)
MGKYEPETLKKREKALVHILEELRKSWIFVEGQKDKIALQSLGVLKIKTISGNLQQSCRELETDVEHVFVLSDLDRRGDQLAKAAKDALEARSIRADIDTRRRLAGILALRCFEDIERKYKEFMKIIKGD